MKKALMIIAIIGIIIIAGSVLYYFVFYIPGVTTEELRLQEQKLEAEKSSQTKEQVKEYISEYNAIIQEFVDAAHTGFEVKLPGIRIKLIKLSVPEGYSKYNDAKDSCLDAMNEIIAVLEDTRILGASEELAHQYAENLGILRSLSISE